MATKNENVAGVAWGNRNALIEAWVRATDELHRIAAKLRAGGYGDLPEKDELLRVLEEAELTLEGNRPRHTEVPGPPE